jgi:hypothetical protein
VSKTRKTRSHRPAPTATASPASNTSIPAADTPRTPRRPRRDEIAALHHARTAADVEMEAADAHPAIDFGPLRNAACDAVLWALKIAEDDVQDWPEARQRVRRVRRALLDSIRGRRHLGASIEDAVFVTQLLVRIFEHDLGVDMGEIALLIEALGLPVDEVPIVRRPQRPARAPTRAPAPVAVIPPWTPRAPAPPPTPADGDDEECACEGCRGGYRNAA